MHPHPFTRVPALASALALALAPAVAPAQVGAAPAGGKSPPGKPVPRSAEQREADRHFQSGVALFKAGKYAEALAEFERAYEISPHPLVLYNIAGCHRQLTHYAEAVTYYRRFLADGKGVVSAERLTGAQAELDAVLALVARVTVTVSPAEDGATLTVDGTPLEHPEMPLILPPGEHRVTAHAPGRPQAERSVRVASGDTLTIDLVIPVPPVGPPVVTGGLSTTAVVAPAPAEPMPRRFAIGAGFGTNLRLASHTGAPSLGVAVGLGSWAELGFDAVMVAYAVIPSIRIRLLGDTLALHAVGAVPVSLTDGGSSAQFAAAALGLGLRYWPMPGIALRLESYAAFADKTHGTSIPAFLGGELWF